MSHIIPDSASMPLRAPARKLQWGTPLQKHGVEVGKTPALKLRATPPELAPCYPPRLRHQGS